LYVIDSDPVMGSLTRIEPWLVRLRFCNSCRQECSEADRKSSDIAPTKFILPVKDEDYAKFFRTRETPSPGLVAGRYDALTRISCDLDLRAN
jgi:hypothetical protein